MEAMPDGNESRSVSLSQVQIIRSLGEALAWFERELQWGVDPAELRHLTGRIGELYVATITRGQMALAVNQRGYDVVTADGQRISVKTVTSSGHVTFRRSTVDQADRIVILRINIDEAEASIEEVEDRADHRIIKQLENGTIVVEIGGVRVPVAKPELRAVAVPLGISLLTGSGGKKNTRQLGADIIAALRA